jgi:purine-nucleoside phosphorylase
MHLDPVAVHAAEVLNHRLGGPIDWALVAGSGLGVGFVAAEGGLGLTIEGDLPLAELGLPAPSVAGHGNRLVWGRVGERRVCVQTGRLHPYEGHSMGVCTAPLAAMLANGARGVVLTFAAGGLDPALNTGELVILKDQIALFGPTPLVGPQFVDCSQMYSPYLRRRLQAMHPGIGPGGLREVVYAHARGPQYETLAETEALRRLGGDVVGMSTTYEAIFCAAHKVALAGVGVVTNSAGATGLSHVEVQQRSDEARVELAGILGKLLAAQPEDDGRSE